MVLVWRITDDSPNLPNFAAIRYIFSMASVHQWHCLTNFYKRKHSQPLLSYRIVHKFRLVFDIDALEMFYYL